ncbi:MAG: phosphoribosylaminoimidazolesuccinocarboxamide synthase [Candidatus Omnitrophica bacterium]|nr:phosphoribosylaminoimidazolesuccinocarboxamide synthase [Candidatus Omnitrophota bacterium]
MNKEVLLSTDLKGLKFFKRGKVRDIYDLDDKLLIVSTDRISCFDVILPDGIPGKGRVLTALSEFWFGFTKPNIPNHFLTCDITAYPKEAQKYGRILEGRSMLVKKSSPLPVECVVRGYLSGSGWKEYSRKQSVCGVKLPPGLRESERLPEPIFTPATKEDTGHDINVTQAHVEKTIGKAATDRLKAVSLAIYKKAGDYAYKKGIIIADTKFEFGILNDDIILIDEALTPDSSRFWPKEGYKPGGPQPSFDKQFVRDYLETVSWDKTPPAPNLPDAIIKKTSEKYQQALNYLLKAV